MRFYNHPEGMVRTTVRNIILSVLKRILFVYQSVKETKNCIPIPPISHLWFISSISVFISGTPGSRLIKRLRMSSYYRIILLCNYTLFNIRKNNNMRVVNLKSYFEDHLDLLLYIDDIFKLNLNKLSDIFSNTLLNYAIFPCLLSSIKKSKKGNSFIKQVKYHLIWPSIYLH